MWEYNYDCELYHHGILGMKWGHRKAAKINNHVIRTRKEYYVSKQQKKVDKLGSKLPGSSAYNKAKIKLYKQKNSRYGQTNGQIIRKALLKQAGVNVVTNTAYKALQESGQKAAANAIVALQTGYLGYNTVKTGYRVGTNYKDRKKSK